MLPPHLPPPLTDVRVIDLSATFMGPYSTRVLAQWGAEVIKVEPPTGDVTRGISDSTGEGLGPIFVNANTGKRSVALDLKQPAGRAVLDDLLASADVVVHSMRDRALRKLDLAADDVLAKYPSIIHCGFRGYGRGGRYADRPAYDDIIQAAAGFARLEAGGAGEPPRYSRQAMADKTVGIYGAAAIMAALFGARSTGSGRAIEVPMFESMVGFLMLDQQGGYLTVPPSGPAGYPRTSSPFRRPYATADGHLAVMIYTDAQWRRFFDLVGRDDLLEDERFSTIRRRTENIDALYHLLEQELAGANTEIWIERLAAADLPCGPVNDMADLFDDPHLVDVGFFPVTRHPVLGEVRVPRSPVPMGDTANRHAPRLGEDSAAIMTELGRPQEEVQALIRSGVLVMPQTSALDAPLVGARTHAGEGKP